MNSCGNIGGSDISALYWRIWSGFGWNPPFFVAQRFVLDRRQCFLRVLMQAAHIFRESV